MKSDQSRPSILRCLKAATVFACLSSPLLAETSIPLYTAQLSDAKDVWLKEVGKMKYGPIDESSGFVQGRKHPDVLWTHNDSGDCARIFAVHKDGSLVAPDWKQFKGYAGIEIAGARNVDWEDICEGPDGTLYIADTGNNFNRRRNLGIYVVDEPNPEVDSKVQAVKHIQVVYPDQDGFPPSERNFDCESIFYAAGHLYLLTKHRSDTMTKLYRVPELNPDVVQVLEPIAAFEAGGQVNGADCSPDGRRLAILTYGRLWVFEADRPGQWFSGKVSLLRFENGAQSEAVCFFDDKILIGNENRQIFEVAPESLESIDNVITSTLELTPGDASLVKQKR